MVSKPAFFYIINNTFSILRYKHAYVYGSLNMDIVKVFSLVTIPVLFSLLTQSRGF